MQEMSIVSLNQKPLCKDVWWTKCETWGIECPHPVSQLILTVIEWNDLCCHLARHALYIYLFFLICLIATHTVQLNCLQCDAKAHIFCAHNVRPDCQAMTWVLTLYVKKDNKMVRCPQYNFHLDGPIFHFLLNAYTVCLCPHAHMHRQKRSVQVLIYSLLLSLTHTCTSAAPTN